MTEEEKKAIEDMNRFANSIDMSCVSARQMQIVLNLIEKLQKENEELEEINNELEAEKNEAIRRYNFETIPKQKVKDKIEELKQEIENLPTEAYPIIEDDLQIKIEVLEELLKKEQ